MRMVRPLCGRATARNWAAACGILGRWQLARRRHDRCQHDEATLAKALHGQWRKEPLFAAAQAVALSDRYPQKMGACDCQIAAPLGTCAARQDSAAVLPVWWPRPRNRPRFDGRGALHRLTGVDLPAMEGIDAPTALTSISEMGLDMGRWPTVKHCTSWLGLCPPHRVAGGKVLSRGTKLCANRAATALRLAASSLHRRPSALGAFCRRMQARWGTPQAITATAQKLARWIDTMLKHGSAYVRQRLVDDEHQYRDQMVQSVTRRAKALGYALVQTSAEVPL